MKGIIASEGIVIGQAFILEKSKVTIPTNSIEDKDKEREIQKLKEAVKVSRNQLTQIRDMTEKKMGKEKAEIFNAHLLILEDPMLQEQVIEFINENKNVLFAVDKAIKKIHEMFEAIPDEYMRERAHDVQDVGTRLLHNIAGVPMVSFSSIEEKVIVFAKDLTPSDTAQMDFDKVLGFVTEMGGKTSHTAIMARSLEVPAIVGAKNIISHIKNGETVILDALTGEICLTPSQELVESYEEKQTAYLEDKRELLKMKDLESISLDGRKIELAANIGTPKDLPGVKKYGADGIGLYRTEFLYMDGSTWPTEETQFEAYKKVVEAMGSKKTIIRTLDIGGDKELNYYEFEKELNPFLGWRAIRMCLDRQDIFKTQLRALLRASAFGSLHIMYPMISNLSEIQTANLVLEEVKCELSKENIPYNPDIPVGIMIETPGAALIAHKLIEVVDFFSIGTNDLTQYTLAVDRGNEKIAHLYTPFHPGVLSLIQQVVDASHKAGKWTGMCGEFAGDENAALLLLGMGLDELSMSAVSLPKVKKIIRNTSYEEAKKIADHVLDLGTAKEVIDYLKNVKKN